MDTEWLVAKEREAKVHLRIQRWWVAEDTEMLG